MYVRSLHHALVVLRRVRLWQVLVLFVVLLGLSALLLRQNSLEMIKLRNATAQADEQNKDIPQAVAKLRDYIAGHMNTSMGDTGIYLEHAYQRDYDRAVQEAAKSGNASAVTYQQADKDCRALFSRTASFPAYIQCVTDKVAASGSLQDPSSIKAPPSELYRYNFTPPLWSLDAAGLAVLATVVTGLFIAGRIVGEWVVYLLLRARRHLS